MKTVVRIPVPLELELFLPSAMSHKGTTEVYFCAPLSILRLFAEHAGYVTHTEQELLFVKGGSCRFVQNVL